ncbi:MAG: NADP-dependent oxidoreductase [Sphingomonadaceae bacterium]|nr:NADP-dependent oxidoreductase [Sphingomonadaceae bacterium]
MDAHEIRLKSRPHGEPGLDVFELAAVKPRAPGEGELLVRNRWMSVDPYMRGRMNDVPSYVPPFKLGEALEGGAVGEVIESNAAGFAVGDLVLSMYGWRTHATAPAKAFQKLPSIPGIAPQAYLGVLGMPGLTAWAGLTIVGELKADDVVFVSGAAGAVGSLAVQIAKLRGATVIGSAGGPKKVEWLRSLGVEAFDYRAESPVDALKRLAPSGISLHFDNVGGDHLEAAMRAARPFARLIECGMIARYNDVGAPFDQRLFMLIIGKRLRIQGFIVFDHQKQMPEFLAEIGPAVARGEIRAEETVVEGLDKAPEAFLGLFRGANLGKMLVKL